MRHKILILPLVFLLFSGCTSKKTVEPVLNNINFSAVITYNDAEFECYVEILDDKFTSTVVKPETIKDFTLRLNSDGVTAEYLGITYTPETHSMPSTAAVQILYDNISDVSKQGITAYCKEENCTIDRYINDYAYSFEFSPSGLPISLSIDDLDLDIKFNNVTVL